MLSIRERIILPICTCWLLRFVTSHTELKSMTSTSYHPADITESRVQHIGLGKFPKWKFKIHWGELTFKIVYQPISSVFINETSIDRCWKWMNNEIAPHLQSGPLSWWWLQQLIAYPVSLCSGHTKLLLLFWSEGRNCSPHGNPFPFPAMDIQFHDAKV